ncbi:hypothetical protein RJ641_025387 [Dillenia turbinata]|uniref:Mediator of RNA polymerase II transcription subunit 19 n=1 Tax=Dillenia turbinata TaxID=194707 RepID=A0AAN8W1I4_9MAGN
MYIVDLLDCDTILILRKNIIVLAVQERSGTVKLRCLGSVPWKLNLNLKEHADVFHANKILMEPEGKKFGRGPRELTGAVDLLSQFQLLPHHDFFCKRSLPLSISDTHYLHNLVGDTEIRKGEGMQLDQLIQNASYSRETNARMQPFDLDTLREAFQLRETGPIDLPSADKGTPTISGKSKGESKDKEKKHKKHKDRDKEKDREHKKHKHRHKDRSKDKDKEKKKEKSGHHDSGNEHSRKHHEKKRKHDGEEEVNDIHRHKKSKHKSSKIDEVGAIKVAG